MPSEMTVEVHGDGEAILFIHGLGGTSNVFSPQVGVLSRFFKCIRPDLPGSGRTATSGAYTLAGMADQMAELLAKQGVAKAHVVAHSMGTVIAAHLAARHPDKVLSLSLVGPLLEPPEPGRAALRDRAAKARSGDMLGIADAVVQGGTSADTRAHRPEIAAFVREILMRQDAEGYALTCEALAGTEAADTTKIKAPTLLITGDEDGTAPARNVLAMSKKIAGSRMEVLGRTGHWATFERASDVTSLIFNFLLNL